MKKVSLIIPCYNVKAYRLDRMMNSILHQKYAPLEIILVDDGSLDDTYERISTLAQKFRRLGYSSYAFTKMHGGCASAINVGLQRCKGDYICFPDADDQLLVGYISKMARFLDENREYGWVRCNAEEVNDNCVNGYYTLVNTQYSQKGRHFERLLAYQIPHVVWPIMIRKEYLEQCIPLLNLHENDGSQEWQLILPLAFYGDSGYINEPLYRYIIYADSFYHSHKSDPVKLKKYFELHTENKIATLKTLPLNNEEYSYAIDLMILGEVKQYRRYNINSFPQSTNEKLFNLCYKYLNDYANDFSISDLNNQQWFEYSVQSLEKVWTLLD